MCIKYKVRKILICLAAIAAIFLYGINVNAQLVYEETFEGARYFNLAAPLTPKPTARPHGLENCMPDDTADGSFCSWSLSRVTDSVFRGTKAGRIEVRRDQPLVGGAQRIRSEITIIKHPDEPDMKRNMWYSFAVMFPAGGIDYGTFRDAFNQWFQDGSRETTIRMEKSKLYLEVTPPAGTANYAQYDLYSTAVNPAPPRNVSGFTLIPVNEWHEFVFHIIHSNGPDGLIEVWRDGVKIHTINGRNNHEVPDPDDALPKWKIGWYSSDLDDGTPLTVYNRIAYVDNIRVGDSTSTIMNMISGTLPTNLLPNVNAGADKVITLPTSTTSFTGTATDVDGTIVSVLWEKISGPTGGAISSPNTLSTNITGLIQGIYQFRLTATDEDGGTGSDVVQVTVNANPPPVANAGADQIMTLPTNSTTLNGSGTDVGGSITAYAWTKVSGPSGGTIVSPSSASTSITDLIQGVYVYRLTVTDNAGLTGSDLITITVNAAPNQVPNANAGVDQTLTLPTSSTTVNGNGSTDADGTIVSYAWVKISGPTGGTLGTPNAVSSTITSLTEGTYVFQLTVTDNIGATDNDLVTITVRPAIPDLPPMANAGPDKIITLPVNSTQLIGSGTDDGTIVSYAWVKISGPAATIASPSSATTNITGMVAGTYIFQLTVTDNIGQTGTDAVQVLVNPAANQLPVANAGSDQTITLPTSTVTFFGSGTDADGTITAYAWVKVSGPTGGTIASPSSATTIISALQVGTYVFRLTVTDNNSATGADLVQVVVNAAPNVPPTANAGADQTITLPTNSTTLTGSGTDPDGTITAYLWTKVSGPSGGAISSPANASTGITGLTQGIYVYSLQVTDNNSATGSDLVTITVNPAVVPPNLPPVSVAGSNQTITLPINSVTLNGSGSYDPDGTILSYWWNKVSGPTGGGIVTPALATTNVVLLTEGVYVFSLLVTDNDGDTGTSSIQITVLPCIRNAPNVNAGADQNIQLPTSTATLTGTASANNCATISARLWSKISGPAGGTITSPTSLTTGVTALEVGTYNFRLLITDNNGDTASDVMQIVVILAQNVPPVAIPGNNQALQLPTNSTTLVGAGTDIDGTITAYLWTQFSGPSNSTITTPTLATTTVTGLIAGTYIYRLRVTDNRGDTASALMQVVVSSAPNIPPIAFAGTNQVVTLPTNSTVLFGTGSSDPDGMIVAYLWTKSSGPSGGTIVSPTLVNTNITGLIAGTYVFRLRITDNAGDTATASVQVTVNTSSLIRPTANAGVNKSVTLPVNSVSATGTGTAPSGTITGYLWTQVSGPSAATINSPTLATTIFFDLIEGTYIMQFKVYDSNGDSATDVMQIVVYPAVNLPPTITINTADTIIYLPNNSLTTSASATDPDGSIASIEWIKVSGPNIYLITDADTYNATISGLTSGTYVFRLIVTDDNGLTSTDDITVSVIALPRPNTYMIFPRKFANSRDGVVTPVN